MTTQEAIDYIKRHCNPDYPSGKTEWETAIINAEQAKIKAEGQAEATRIKAKAEAEANKLIAESLTPELIENNKIDKWSGNVPTVSGTGMPIIDLSGVAE